MKRFFSFCNMLAASVCMLLPIVGCGPATDPVKTAPASAAEAPNGPGRYTWDQVCESAAERLTRCPKETRVDGAFVRRCATAEQDRACFNTFNERTAGFLMGCLRDKPCDKSGSVFGKCAETLFQGNTLTESERAEQEICRARMSECKLEFQERCTAPFLKVPLNDKIRRCLGLPCDQVRKCAEGVMEFEGCR